MFPGALFVHMVRDGRAVANSLANVDFWQGWGGPARLGLELSEEEREEWRRSEHSFIVLAAIQWKRWMEAYETAKNLIPPQQYLEIKYEDLAAHPMATFGEVLSFCGLRPSTEFERRLQRFKVRSENNKWRQQLTEEQQERLNASLRSFLERYGYANAFESDAAVGRYAIPAPARS